MLSEAYICIETTLPWISEGAHDAPHNWQGRKIISSSLYFCSAPRLEIAHLLLRKLFWLCHCTHVYCVYMLHQKTATQPLKFALIVIRRLRLSLSWTADFTQDAGLAGALGHQRRAARRTVYYDKIIFRQTERCWRALTLATVGSGLECKNSAGVIVVVIDCHTRWRWIRSSFIYTTYVTLQETRLYVRNRAVPHIAFRTICLRWARLCINIHHYASTIGSTA